jgi:hypothetical protein
MTCRTTPAKPKPRGRYAETVGVRHFASIARQNETVR